MQENLHALLISFLKETVVSCYGEAAPVGGVPVELSLSTGFGDLSSNTALRLSGILKKPPIKIAGELTQAMRAKAAEGPLRGLLADIKAEGAGFINFYLDNGYFHGQLRNIIERKEDFARSDIGGGRKVLIEFVSANPTGPLSVAHARQAAVGDALANILGYLGFEVSREYYLNDEGNQINILGDSIALRMKELAGEKVEFPENYYQGEYIYEIARKVKSQKTPVKSIAEYGAQDILSTIERELADFGVRFDSWYSQKSLREKGKIEASFDFLKAKGFLYEQDGALWFRSTEFGDDKDRVVLKRDGSYTYLAPDIAYHREKFLRGYQWLINLWGPDHHGYIGRLKAAVAALGGDPSLLSVIIVQLASIFKEGKPVEMSTRKGQYITLREVLDEVGKDAARYFFLMRKTSSHLNFDLEVAKKQTPENPVFYVQYAYARICSILRASPPEEGPESVDAVTALVEPEELALIKKLWQFPYILDICHKTLDPYMITVFLQETAENFHRFYDRHRVLGQETRVLRARIALLHATRIVFSAGLGLLGVGKPEKM